MNNNSSYLVENGWDKCSRQRRIRKSDDQVMRILQQLSCQYRYYLYMCILNKCLIKKCVQNLDTCIGN